MPNTNQNTKNDRVGDFIKSPTKDFLRTLDCSKFFPRYAPGVKAWKYKLRGYSSKNKPLDFSFEDYKNIVAGLKKMATQIFISSIENDK